MVQTKPCCETSEAVLIAMLQRDLEHKNQQLEVKDTQIRELNARLAESNAALVAAQSGNRAAGLPQRSHGLCVYRNEMRGFHADHRSDGLSGQQPHHRPLLRL